MIRVRSLTVRLDGRPVVDGVDLDADRGQWVGLIGPNGAGKTTVLKAIAGLVESRGSVVVDRGRPVSIRERARTIGFVPQRPVTPPSMRVIDYVMLGRSPHIGYLRSETSHDVAVGREALADLGMSEYSRRSLGTLSGGELQRVVLARVITQQTPVVLLDEPTASLDMGSAQQVLGVIDDLRRDRGLTVVSAMHDLTLAAQFCDRLVMISAGVVAASGSATTVLTETSIRIHYGASVRVFNDDAGGVVVVPLRDRTSEQRMNGVLP